MATTVGSKQETDDDASSAPLCERKQASGFVFFVSAQPENFQEEDGFGHDEGQPNLSPILSAGATPGT